MTREWDEVGVEEIWEKKGEGTGSCSSSRTEVNLSRRAFVSVLFWSLVRILALVHSSMLFR